MTNKEAHKSEISTESTTKNDLESDHTISTLDDFINYGKKTFGVGITIKKSDNPDTYEKLFGDIKADCLSREFQEIVVEYPSVCIYPEYKGKPYYSIKYQENDKEYVGFGTYNPEVLSGYLREYFIPDIQPKTGHWINCGSFVTCSECGEEQYGIDTGRFYCQNCGAKMVDPQERSES